MYSVKVRETQVNDVWYDVEADSAEEAAERFYEGEVVDSDYMDTVDYEVLEVEYHED
jgi:hypothetical protein